jgi:hypothetical protein
VVATLHDAAAFELRLRGAAKSARAMAAVMHRKSLLINQYLQPVS